MTKWLNTWRENGWRVNSGRPIVNREILEVAKQDSDCQEEEILSKHGLPRRIVFIKKKQIKSEFKATMKHFSISSSTTADYCGW